MSSIERIFDAVQLDFLRSGAAGRPLPPQNLGVLRSKERAVDVRGRMTSHDARDALPSPNGT